jgi:hypothetical protein
LKAFGIYADGELRGNAYFRTPDTPGGNPRWQVIIGTPSLYCAFGFGDDLHSALEDAFTNGIRRKERELTFSKEVAVEYGQDLIEEAKAI